MANEKELIDYDNLAFNPYAISTGDLTIENDNIKSDKGSMDNHGYSNQSEAVVENNPHYEDTLEVVKKAGLTGTGPRKKENIIYEETIINKKIKTKPKSQSSGLGTCHHDQQKSGKDRTRTTSGKCLSLFFVFWFCWV